MKKCLRKIRPLFITLILVIPISLFAQDDKNIQPKHKKKISIAVESGLTVNYPDRVNSNGIIKGLVTKDPYFGILTSFQYDNFAFETGLLRHVYTCGARINDPTGESTFGASSEESAVYRIPFRISYEFQTGYKNLSVEPFAGASKLVTRHRGVYDGFSGSSMEINQGDTTFSSTEASCVHPVKSVWTTNVGLKIKYTYKKVSFCLIGEYFSSNHDWNFIDVTYSRTSNTNGVLNDSGRIYTKARSLCFGAYILFAL